MRSTHSTVQTLCGLSRHGRRPLRAELRYMASTHVLQQMHRRRQIQAVSTPTQWEAVELLRNNGFTIDQARLDRVFNDPHAQPVHGNVSITVAGLEIVGLVKGTYRAKIVVGPQIDCDCDCPDWLQSGGKANQLPCKHILGLAVDASLAGQVPQPGAAQPAQAQPVSPTTTAAPSTSQPPPTASAATPSTSFPDQVCAAIAAAIETLADQVQALLDAGEIPFLIGPTDCGKTSAVRRVAVRNGWLFEPVEGCESYADLDLVGAIIDGRRLAGPFARAFGQVRPRLPDALALEVPALLGDLQAAQVALAAAQQQAQTASMDEVERLLAQVQTGFAAARLANGKRVLIFLDEFTRFNTRAMDILMTPLLPTPAEVARLMGIEADEDVRYVNAPLWGREWAPVSKTPVVLACNPWGSSLDPALLRRTLPLQVDFSAGVAALFHSPLKDAIEKSWEMAREGRLPLPIGYKALRTAAAPDDRRFMTPYLLRLRAADPAAAEGYRKIVEAAGFRF